ncbi:MAG: dolichol kinase [Myxococcota bacterium]|jgi:dolichol kinase
MTDALTLESQQLAGDLYKLLRALDPARWQDDLGDALHKRLDGIRQRVDDILRRLDGDRFASLKAPLLALAALLKTAAPTAQVQEAWNDFRLAAMPLYEELAAGLKSLDIHIPSLRPTNYARNLLHASGGVAVMLFILHLFTPTTMLLVAGSAAVGAWGLEIGRRLSPRVNALCMKMLGRFAHPHETWRVNSSTWYITAMLGLALTGDIMLAALSVGILAFADPAAAIIGRRFGRTSLINGRSLEGTLAFAVVGTLVGLGMLSVYFPDFGLTGALIVALAAAVPAAVAELLSRRIDDNLSVPLSAAAGAWLVLQFL